MKKSSKKSKFKEFLKTFLSLYVSADIDITSVAAAYYIIISVFPALMLLASLLPYFQFDVNQILTIIEDLFPKQLYPTVANLVSTALTQPSSSWLGISIVSTLWAISKSMSALQKAFNKAYGVEEHRDFIISHIVGIFLGIGLQLIITFSVMVLAFGKTVLQALQRFLDFDHAIYLDLANQTTPIVYLALFLSLVMLYLFLPNVRIKKVRLVFPGAIFVMVVMGTVGNLFAVYVNSYAARLMDFRFVTSVVILVLMLWFVFMSKILITGAVLNAAVQSLFVDEFYTRDGDVVSILNRIKARFRNTDTNNQDEHSDDSEASH